MLEDVFAVCFSFLLCVLLLCVTAYGLTVEMTHVEQLPLLHVNFYFYQNMWFRSHRLWVLRWTWSTLRSLWDTEQRLVACFCGCACFCVCLTPSPLMSAALEDYSFGNGSSCLVRHTGTHTHRLKNSNGLSGSDWRGMGLNVWSVSVGC